MIDIQTQAYRRVYKGSGVLRFGQLFLGIRFFRRRLSRASSVSLVIPGPLLAMQNDKDQEVMVPLAPEKDMPSPLPVPVSTQPQKPKLTAVVIIPVWIVLSSTVIIYNNYIYNTLYFKYPVFLVTWHLAFAVRSFCYASPAFQLAPRTPPPVPMTNESHANHRFLRPLELVSLRVQHTY